MSKLNGEAEMDKEMFIQEIEFKSATGSTVVSLTGVRNTGLLFKKRSSSNSEVSARI